MAEAAKKSKPRKKTRVVNPDAVAFTVWAADGGPLPADVVDRIEAAIESATFDLFFEGKRVLTQTTRA